ncbi:MAG: serine hydrolase domain-containing protein [Thermomicrobiales bacterium]
MTGITNNRDLAATATAVDMDALMEQVDAVVAGWMAENRAPALQLAITDRDGLLATRAYGYADFAAQRPLTDAELFEFGSIGKSFTAIICLQLAEEGVLDLHAPVTQYLPWFEIPSRFAPITLHHLLTHTAGLINGSDFSPDPRYEVWALRESEASELGVKARYSNAGYKLVGLLLEQVTGQPYAQLVQERIFAPLGMDTAEGAVTNAARAHMAVGYTAPFRDRPWRPEHGWAPATWFETNTADGCLIANASELATYLRMLLNRGDSPGGRILSEASFAQLTTPHTHFDADEPYGYGLGLHEKDGRPRVAHSGGMVGYISQMIGDPEAGVGVVALTNAMLDTEPIAEFALQSVVNARRGDAPPAPPAPPATEYASYAGVFTGPHGAVTIEAGPTGLTLLRGEERISLHPSERSWRKDAFLANHPDFALAVIQFRRNDDDAVTEFTHGADWYRGERYDGPTEFETPPEWLAYVGHYTSHNPWFSDLRIGVCKGELCVMHGGGAPQSLVQDGDRFRPADDAEGPEWFEFDTIVNGEALRVREAGGNALYRFFTP